MAEMLNDIEEQGEIEAVEQVAKQEPHVEQKPDIPEKYRGKSLEDVVRMHQEADKQIGRQAQEVGEVRRLADELLKSQLTSKVEKEKPVEIDFFDDPQASIRQAIANSPEVLQAKQMAEQLKHERSMAMLVQKHPDKDSVLQDDEFNGWIKSSKVRSAMFNKAHHEYDYDIADELLTTYKQLKESKKQQVTQAISEVETKARDKVLQSVSVDSGGSGESSKKNYTRAKLLEMQLRRPEEYAAFADSGELSRAYLEGRVK